MHRGAFCQFLSGGFTTMAVMNLPERKLAKCTSVHCLPELFPIYQIKHWTIRQQDNHTVVPSSHRIILEIVGFLVKTAA